VILQPTYITAAVGTEYVVDSSWGQEFCAGLRSQAGEPIVRKHRASAFVGTDLDLILRSNRIKSAVVTGCVTHGCVLETARHGAYNDYYVIVVKDCVASTTQELHEATLKIMEDRLDVTNSQEIVKAWTVSE